MAKDTGRSLRGGTIRSRHSRWAVVSPSFASSMALRVKAFASPSSSFSAATVALPRLPSGLPRVSRLKRPPSRFCRVNSWLLLRHTPYTRFPPHLACVVMLYYSTLTPKSARTAFYLSPLWEPLLAAAAISGRQEGKRLLPTVSTPNLRQCGCPRPS
jgi:hypothetical protein